MALSIDDVIDVLTLTDTPSEQRKAILARLKKLEEEKKAERENNKIPKPKREAYVVIKDLKGGLTNDDVVASVFIGDEGTDHAMILSSIRSGVVEFNENRKKKRPILTFTHVLEFLKPKWLKGQAGKLKKVTPEWCQTIIITPEQDSSFITPQLAK